MSKTMLSPAVALQRMFLNAIDMDKAVSALAGPNPADLDTCPQCDGAGYYWDDQTGQPDEPNGGRNVTCWACKGEGIVDTSPCIACGGPSYDHDAGCPLDGQEEVRG